MLLEIIFTFLISYVVVDLILMTYNLYKLKNNDINQTTSINVIDVDIEEINGMYYVWNKRDRSFVAQGKNIDEIRKTCEVRFPGYSIIADANQLKSLGL